MDTPIDPIEDCTPDGLTPANQNPWYVLATLYGEQVGESIDTDLHAKNRAVWNAWAGQALTEEERIVAARNSKVPLEEISAWESIKDIVVNKFQYKWVNRNGNSIDLITIPDPKDNINFSFVLFSFLFNLRGCIFQSDSYFIFSKFNRNAQFDYCTFNGLAFFKRSKFIDGAKFSHAMFMNESDFFGVEFVNGVSFIDSEFQSNSYFISVKFIGVSWFISSIFKSDAIFIASYFSGTAYFTEAKFGTVSGKERVDFSDVTFEKPVNFRAARFLSTYPIFAGTVMQSRNVFTVKAECWPEVTVQNIVKARESCATIRHLLDNQGLPEDAHFFFRREMAFAGKIGSWWQRLPYRLYGWFSDYGHSIQRPLLWLLGLIVLGWGAIGAWLNWAVLSEAVGSRTASPLAALDLTTPLGVSVANALPFLGLGRLMYGEFYAQSAFAIKALSAGQSVLGLVFVFLLGLGLRTRFRMR